MCACVYMCEYKSVCVCRCVYVNVHETAHTCNGVCKSKCAHMCTWVVCACVSECECVCSVWGEKVRERSWTVPTSLMMSRLTLDNYLISLSLSCVIYEMKIITAKIRYEDQKQE